MLLLLLACNAKDECPAGTIWMDGVCLGFERHEPDEDDDVEVWTPAIGTTWQWQLQGTIDTSSDVEVYDIDLFDVPDEVLQTLVDDGRVPVCYFSAGSYEDWREDADDYPPAVLGDPLGDWEGEWWVDIRDDRVRDILAARMDLAVERGCVAVEPDNVDAYTNANGLDLTAEDQLDFNLWLAEAAHERGLSVGLKNDLDQLEDLVDHFDWHLDESCHDYDECDRLSVFTDAGKASFVAEYVDDWGDAEAKAAAVCGTHPDQSTIIKTWDLGSEHLACD